MSSCANVGLETNLCKDIFEDPKFTVNGMHENDVQQGQGYDCYFMSAICTLSRRQDLLEKVCIARDEKVGVYGFVFYQSKSRTSPRS